jgi:phosphatidate cytidylyltransferase
MKKWIPIKQGLSRLDSELSRRVLTAMVLLGFVISAIFYLSPPFFAGVSAGLVLLAGWELARLQGYLLLRTQCLYLMGLGLSLYTSQFLGLTLVFSLGNILGFSVLAYMGYLVVQQPRHLPNWLRTVYGRVGVALFSGTSLVIFWCCLQILKINPPYLLLGLLVVCITDTLAYFIGRTWGRRRLLAVISPNKSWEGVLAGVLGTLLLSIIGLKSYFPFISKYAFLYIVLLTSVISIAGDLFESLLKRQQQLKDSGQWLPGHGGLLDRMDSLIIALPVFTAGLYALNPWV